MKPLRRVWRILLAAIAGFNRNDGAAMSGYIAFTGLLSIFPFLIFAATLTGILVGSSQSENIIEALFDIVPEHVAKTLEPVVVDVLSNQSSEVLTMSGLFAIWTASNAINAFRIAFDRAYRVDDPRGFLKNRAMAIVLVVVGAIVAALLGFSILLSPLILQFAEKFEGTQIPAFAGSATYGFGMVVFIGFLLLMHRTLPGRQLLNSRRWPGVIVSTVLWMAAATGFSWYLSYFSSYTVTYGTLAGVIITLMFFYITGATIIFGAEVNAALARPDGDLARQRETTQWPSD